MDAGSGLLQAILEEPDRDDLRLIFADWLEEHGEPERAEFIRVQCALANSHCRAAGVLDGPYDVYCNNSLCRHCELDRRATELLGRDRAHRSGYVVAEEEWWWLPVALQEIWLQVFRCWHDEQPNWTWRRGFIEAVDFYCQDWLKVGPELVRCQPIRRVRLSDRQPRMTVEGQRWRWHEGGTAGRSSWWADDLPSDLFALLEGGRKAHPWSRSYETEDEALLALSRACLLWAKQQARHMTPTPAPC